MSAPIILTLAFFVFLLLGVPVAVSIGLAAIAGMIAANIPLSFVVQAAYSAVNDFLIIAVPMFVLAGVLMEKGGLTSRLIAFSRSLVGPTPGGLATVTIVACTFFAAISGSGPATAAAIGSIMIPTMIKEGYHKSFAAAVTSNAGGIGVVIPPSIPMIIYGITAEVSITGLFVAGVIPGILLAVALTATSRVISRRRGYAIANPDGRSARTIFAAAWEARWAILAPVIILGGIYTGLFTVTEASVVAVLYALFVGIFIYRTLTLSNFFDSMTYAVRLTGVVLFVLVSGRLLGRVLTIFQVPQNFSNLMINTFDNPVVLILLIIALLIFVGMWMETLTQLIILTPLLLPVAVNAGIDPIQFGIMFVIACEIGYSTPPLGVNLFVASEISNASVEEVSKASIPLILAEIGVLLLVTFVPQLSLFLPRLLGFIY
ncbi:TRAP transporter large permease [Hoeflea olei]|uniref:TRAP transporter large permease protein n=1 Tax=Hoeflea olei TaxID=1480615 RepID=A0A1C1Z0G8_9HYPH|nr:TRAP transporter large permease [Hoeflea olei]OCW59261.1 C4-dicarboxylate ABC transporter permease [Hoeflea olei]